MAEKKSGTRAEQAATGAKKNSAAGKTGGKATPPKKKAPEKVKKGNSDFSGGLAPNVLIAVLSVVLFALFLAIAVNPDGALLRAADDLAAFARLLQAGGWREQMAPEPSEVRLFSSRRDAEAALEFIELPPPQSFNVVGLSEKLGGADGIGGEHQ